MLRNRMMSVTANANMLLTTDLPQFDNSVMTQGLISDTAIHFTALIVKMIINPVLTLGGIIINLINIAVFCKMGLKHGTILNFFILSLSDGLLALCILVSGFSYILISTENDNRIIQTAYWVSLSGTGFAMNVSIVITVAVSIVRCCSVAIPLRVKQILTTRRQMTAIFIVVSAICSTQIYALSSARFVSFHDPRKNASRVLMLGTDFALLDSLRNSFLYTSFSIVIVCVIILSVALKKSTRFQISASSLASELKPKDTHPRQSSREAQVVKTVVLVAAIFIASNIPMVTMTMLRMTVKDFSTRGRFRNLYRLAIILSETGLLVNVDANSLVYYAYNTQYRKTFQSMISLRAEIKTTNHPHQNNCQIAGAI